MSEAKHMRRPWEWISNDMLSSPDGEILKAEDDRKPYGMHSALIEHHYEEEIAEANRLLIASAPDLLEMLQGVLKCQRGILGHIFLEGWQEDAIRAAIEKATKVK